MQVAGVLGELGREKEWAAHIVDGHSHERPVWKPRGSSATVESVADFACAANVRQRAISQNVRKRIEEVFGWIKTVGNFRKTRYIGLGANQVAAYVLASAYNLLRMASLLPGRA